MTSSIFGGIGKLFSKVEDTITEAQRTDKVKKWLDELEEAGKREKEYLKDGRRVQDLYEMAKGESSGATSAFNVLYANTELLAPALYNATPRPVVKRKTQKQNPVAIAAAMVLQHFLVYQSDPGHRGCATLDDLMEGAVLEALVPGRGVSRFAYDSEVEEAPEAEILEGPEGPGDTYGADESQMAENPAALPPAMPQITKECIIGDQVPWDRIRFGYAKQWHKLPWIAFEHFLTRDECIDTFGEKKGKEIKLTHLPSEDKDGTKDRPADSQGVKFAHIWEIWDKQSGKVLFVSEGSTDVIQEDDDPLQLEGFFPIPRPLIFLRRVSSLVPNILYLMYEEQAKELNDVTVRIGKLTRALKVRGFYDGTLEGLGELMKAGDNTLIPTPNVAAMQQGQTLDKAIWMMPLTEIVQVLQQLYSNRQQLQSTLQQLSGIADIMRGQAAASETLGAQQIKQNWGSLRLKRLQRLVGAYARESFRIMAELAANHFQQETFQKVTGLQFPTNAQKAQTQQQMEQAQQRLQLMSQPQIDPTTGQPLPPNPQQQQQVQQQQQQMQQQLQMAQAMLKMPSWEDICQFIKNDELRNYVVDIQTNSTVDVEATEDKEQLSEFMNSFSQLMNGMLPMVEQGIMPFEASKSIMLAVVQKFRLDDEVEEAIRNMKQPQPKPDPVMAKVEGQLKIEQQKHQMEMDGKKQDAALEQQNAQQEAALRAQDLRIRQQEMQMRERELQMKEEFMVAKHQRDMESLAVKAATQGASNANV